MLGFLQCMLISSCGGNYTNTMKATPLEMPIQCLTKESTSTTDNVDKSSDNVEHSSLIAESNTDSESSKDKNDGDNNLIVNIKKGKQTSHSVALILNQDIKTMKNYIERDCEKEYAFSLHDQPGAQRSKQFYLDSIEILFKECSKAGGV